MYRIKDLINSVSPYPIKNDHDWLFWPPDIFAITSLIMQKTGCYRIALIEPHWWVGPSWGEMVKKSAAEWIEKVGHKIALQQESLPEFNMPVILPQKDARHGVEFTVDVLWKRIMESETDIHEIRRISEYREPEAPGPPEKDVILELARDIYVINTIADAACAGFGLPTTQAKRPNFETNKQGLREKSIVHCLANLLLVSTGSLSTLSKIHGSVFPKMRTPQTGMVLRSTSHHLTFHTTEIEVMWRTIPWLQGHQKSLNILAIPAPFIVQDKDFEVVQDQYHAVQYFRPHIKDKPNEAFLKRIVALVKEKTEEIGQIHFLIFPEVALSQTDYEFLLNTFEDSLQLSEKDGRHTEYRLPVIVAGVMKKHQKEYFENKVKIASYFAGRWYDASQRKHHRWQLDRKQIIQYSLQATLPTERKWFEYTYMSQRRLTVLAPNGWLAMTALVCEDLARLEPVSEIIRGIGPTFLTALLSDGPQLTSRWPARYASVLADDPGSGVLTLTSFGMAQRSKRLDNNFPSKEVDEKRNEKRNEKVIGLWKDMINGTRTISAEIDDQKINKDMSSGNAQGVLLTVSAVYQEEFTLDGRSDEVSAATFELDNVKAVSFDWAEDEPGHRKAQTADQDLMGNWDDIRDLSLFIYTLDSSIDLYKIGEENSDNFEKLQQLLFSWWSASENTGQNYPNHIRELINKLESNLKDPGQSGIEVHHKTKGLEYKRGADEKEITGPIDTATSIFKNALVPEDTITTLDFYKQLISVSKDYYSELIRESDQKLSQKNYPLEIQLPLSKNKITITKPPQQGKEEKDEYKKGILELRIRLAVPVAIAMLIDNKLGNWKIKISEKHNPKDIETIKEIRREIKNFLNKSYGERILHKWGNPQ